jgi:hypothetical protein
MSEPEPVKKHRGRPRRSASGLREIVTISLSPEARALLNSWCERPVAPIPASRMIEDLIWERAKRMRVKSAPK